MRFLSPLKRFFFSGLYPSSSQVLYLELAGVVFSSFFCSPYLVSLKIFVFLDSLLRALRDPGGNGRTEPLHYIAGLHPSCYSYEHGFPN